MKVNYAIVGLIGLSLVAAGCAKKPADKMMMDNKDGAMMQDKGMMGDDKMMMDDGVMVGGALMVKSKNIVENASLANNVTTLVAAVKAAGLVETLSGPGPFTVFGPTNAAFDKLPKGTVESLLTPAKKADLTKILTYHVVAGRYMAKDLKDGQMLKTVEGENLKVTVKDGKVMINGAMIETADVVSSNGITHVIDTVLMPGAMMMSGDKMMQK